MSASGIPVLRAATPESARRRMWMRSLLASPIASIALTLVAMIVVGFGWLGGTFAAKSNLNIIGTSITVPLLLGSCSAFALLSGVVDLSIGSNAGLTATLFALMVVHHFNAWLAAIVVLMIGGLIGAFNALVVVNLNASPIAATLGTLSMLAGLQYVANGTGGSVQALIPRLYQFANVSVGPVPLVLLLVLSLVAIAAYVVAFTRVGRHVRAVGGDERAALRAGISVNRIRRRALVLSGVGGALAGMLFIGQLGGTTNTLASDAVFLVYAGLMIGGYSIIRGGVGSPVGGAMGLVVIAGVMDVVAAKSFNTYYTDVIVGGLLLVAVLVDRIKGGDVYE